MARTRKALPTQVDIAHLISAGMLASVCPRALIEQVLSDTGKASQRERLLPAPAVVYYVMALALWREAPLEEVLRVVCEGLQWLGDQLFTEQIEMKVGQRAYGDDRNASIFALIQQGAFLSDGALYKQIQSAINS